MQVKPLTLMVSTKAPTYFQTIHWRFLIASIVLGNQSSFDGSTFLGPHGYDEHSISAHRLRYLHASVQFPSEFVLPEHIFLLKSRMSY